MTIMGLSSRLYPIRELMHWLVKNVEGIEGSSEFQTVWKRHLSVFHLWNPNSDILETISMNWDSDIVLLSVPVINLFTDTIARLFWNTCFFPSFDTTKSSVSNGWEQDLVPYIFNCSPVKRPRVHRRLNLFILPSFLCFFVIYILVLIVG